MGAPCEDVGPCPGAGVAEEGPLRVRTAQDRTDAASRTTTWPCLHRGTPRPIRCAFGRLATPPKGRAPHSGPLERAEGHHLAGRGRAAPRATAPLTLDRGLPVPRSGPTGSLLPVWVGRIRDGASCHPTMGRESGHPIAVGEMRHRRTSRPRHSGLDLLAVSRQRRLRDAERRSFIRHTQRCVRVCVGRPGRPGRHVAQPALRPRPGPLRPGRRGRAGAGRLAAGVDGVGARRVL